MAVHESMATRVVSRRDLAQGGFSLLETLISIALTAIVVLGLAAGLLTTLRSAEVANRVQVADSALASFSESLRSMPYPEPTVGICPTADGTDGYETAYASFADAWTAPGVSLDVISIEHWNPAEGGYQDTCPAVDPSVHRLTIAVTIDGEETKGQTVVARQ